ncbi:hypothetical protein BOW55_16220 [Flavobacterium sp. YO12]|nr:hypothetical protein BOW55_16220 [Flavobacterium sp. YO12]
MDFYFLERNLLYQKYQIMNLNNYVFLPVLLNKKTALQIESCPNANFFNFAFLKMRTVFGNH